MPLSWIIDGTETSPFLANCRLSMREGITFTAVVILGYLVGTMAMSDKSEGSSLLSEGNNALCSKLYGVLKNQSKGNIFYSAASLEFALALLYAGAEGNTAKEIQSVLKLPESKEKTYAAVAASLNGLTGSKNITLNIADGLFVQNNFKLRQSYVDIAKKYFSSAVTNVNFVEPEAVKIINGFVAKETNQKITQLFTPDSFDSMTRLVIANAIYFKGNWAHKFSPSSTFKGDFHLNKTDKVKVDFMKQEEEFNMGFSDELKATIIVLPYQGNDMSMVLIVPEEIDGLKRVEDKVINVNLMNLVKNTHSQKIVLTMPKFKLEDNLKLKNVLSQIGLAEMFSDRANLSGIADEPLFVSDVVQKSYIEVNEEGAEAAAATGITVASRMMPLPPMEINVNSPFLFFIKDSSDSILFMGRFSRP